MANHADTNTHTHTPRRDVHPDTPSQPPTPRAPPAPLDILHKHKHTTQVASAGVFTRTSSTLSFINEHDALFQRPAREEM